LFITSTIIDVIKHFFSKTESAKSHEMKSKKETGLQNSTSFNFFRNTATSSKLNERPRPVLTNTTSSPRPVSHKPPNTKKPPDLSTRGFDVFHSLPDFPFLSPSLYEREGSRVGWFPVPISLSFWERD
jgi:hypothetical protein